MEQIVGVIPSRWGSTRFPGKSLAMISGKPMIRWVVERVKQAKKLDAVIVATDDLRIADCVHALELPGVQVAMTRTDHPSGTDRIAEAVQSLEVDAVINVQGDEPEMKPDMIDQVVELLVEEPDCVISTLACRITDRAELDDPNAVKVVLGQDGRALYFSRRAIPYVRDPEDAKAGDDTPTHLKHIGIYGYRRDFLATFTTLPQAPLEKLEKLEQLRALHYGYRIAVGITPYNTLGIDTPADFEAFLARIAQAEVRGRVKEERA